VIKVVTPSLVDAGTQINHQKIFVAFDPEKKLEFEGTQT
jgi:hypothetical protein